MACFDTHDLQLEIFDFTFKVLDLQVELLPALLLLTFALLQGGSLFEDQLHAFCFGVYLPLKQDPLSLQLFLLVYLQSDGFELMIYEFV